MTLRESGSQTGHFITSPVGQLFRKLRRLENAFPVSSKSKMERPLRHPAPPAESPSMNTSFVPSGENAGTIITVLPRPQLFVDAEETFTGAVPGVDETCQTT